jgi:NAD(P)-dependent dehydrogenase (short-subunit alcohol dehydrogenase family)
VSSLVGCGTATLFSFARHWTLDLKERKIRVNAVSPGGVPTPGYDLMGLTKEQVKGFVDLQVKQSLCQLFRKVLGRFLKGPSVYLSERSESRPPAP